MKIFIALVCTVAVISGVSAASNRTSVAPSVSIARTGVYNPNTLEQTATRNQSMLANSTYNAGATGKGGGGNGKQVQRALPKVPERALDITP